MTTVFDIQEIARGLRTEGWRLTTVRMSGPRLALLSADAIQLQGVSLDVSSATVGALVQWIGDPDTGEGIRIELDPDCGERMALVVEATA